MTALSYAEPATSSQVTSSRNAEKSPKAYNEAHTRLHVERVMQRMDELGAEYRSIDDRPGWFVAVCPYHAGDRPSRYACSVDEEHDLFDRLFATAIRDRLTA